MWALRGSDDRAARRCRAGKNLRRAVTVVRPVAGATATGPQRTRSTRREPSSPVLERPGLEPVRGAVLAREVVPVSAPDPYPFRGRAPTIPLLEQPQNLLRERHCRRERKP